MVLLVLAVVWAAVLIPPAVRARAEGRPGDSISAFRRQLAGLHRTSPRSAQVRMAQPVGTSSHHRPRVTAPPVVSNATRRRTLKRRRDVLTGLVAAAVVTLVLGAIPALRAMWVLHLLVDTALAAYVVLLVRLRNITAEKEMKVRFLPFAVPLDPMAEPVLLRQSAN